MKVGFWILPKYYNLDKTIGFYFLKYNFILKWINN